ncbi:MAG: alcohol dehydrogenase catalytic domain-containing protein [Anaerolineae bacterium]
MRAVVFYGIGDIRLDKVPEPRIQSPTDAIVRLTSTAICSTDLRVVHGSMGPMKPGTILGHEGVGIVERLGSQVRDLDVGDRVVIPASIACGYCAYCRAGYYSQCDNANPNGKRAGPAFFGGPISSGSFDGMQAELVRVPFANVGLFKLPEEVTDEQAITLSDILPTGFYGADVAEIEPGDAVAVFGCGPVGLFAIASAKLMRAGRILAVDRAPSRLHAASEAGAEVINYDEKDPVQTITDLTGGIGVDRAIDTVGIDAELPAAGPARGKLVRERRTEHEEQFRQEQVAQAGESAGRQRNAGSATSLALQWETEALAKTGTLAIVGVYPPDVRSFPIGLAMSKNLTVHMGICPHRRYIPMLLEMIQSGVLHPEQIVMQNETFPSALEALERHQAVWGKVELLPRREAEGQRVR